LNEAFVYPPPETVKEFFELDVLSGFVVESSLQAGAIRAIANKMERSRNMISPNKK
jgi:hypothetical protein